MTWTVTRQMQWPDGANLVEVSEGGIDYTNPDALSAKYAGEFKEFEDPREAAETAIEICKQWRHDRPKDKPKVGAGATWGMTMPFDPSTFKELRTWAKLLWNKLEKCGCGKPLPEKKHRWTADDWSGAEFCSEYCANKEQEYQQQWQAENNPETED